MKISTLFRQTLTTLTITVGTLPHTVFARTLDPGGGFSGDIPSLVGRAIRIFTGISGSIALLMFIYGGFLWLTSGGSPEKIKKGKDVFVWSVIGLAIIFGSYAILNTLFGAIGAAK